VKLKRTAMFSAILAAALYAINVPFSKLLLDHVEPTMMAAFLYLGAGGGLFLYSAAERLRGRQVICDPLTRAELPYTIAMVVLDIAAPILLMLGISHANAANVSLLNNFEIVATSLIAFLIFREAVSRRLCAAIVLVTLASVLLGFEGKQSFSFNLGSLFVIGACICWGMENNCTRMISSKSSVEIVIIKGTFSGLGSLIIAFFASETLPEIRWIVCVLLLGFVAYGLSIHFYILAQKYLGAAKTSAFYSIAPFIGVAFSFFLGERPQWQFYAALLVMTGATVLMVLDTLSIRHTHMHIHTHTHEHSHGDLLHTHEHTHEHTHSHEHTGPEERHLHRHMRLEEHQHVHA